MDIARLLKDRFFYGWVVTLAAVCVTTTAFGVLYSFGVFFKAWLAQWAAPRAVLSAVFSLEFFSYGVFSLLMGAMSDRWGLRRTLALGGVVMGAGCLLTALATSAWMVFITWGLMVGIGVGTAYSPCAAVVSRWFVRSKGFAVGLVVSGLGLGTLILPPLCEYLLATLGWRAAAMSLGILVLVVYLGAAWLVRQEPADLGLSPLGQNPAPASGPAAPGAAGQTYGLRQALALPSFWILFAIHALWVLGMSMPMVHLVPFATDLSIAPHIAARMLAVLGGVSVLGRVFLAMVTERLGTKRSLIGLLTFQALTMLWLARCSTQTELWLFTVLFGFSYGGLASVFPLASAEYFGLRAMGSIFGLLILGATIGGTVGPFLAGYLFDLNQSYFGAFIIGGLVMVLGAALPLGLRRKS